MKTRELTIRIGESGTKLFFEIIKEDDQKKRVETSDIEETASFEPRRFRRLGIKNLLYVLQHQISQEVFPEDTYLMKSDVNGKAEIIGYPGEPTFAEKAAAKKQ